MGGLLGREIFGQLLHLRLRLGLHLLGAGRQPARIEGDVWRGAGGGRAGVSPGEPVTDVEEFAHGGERIGRRDRFRAVDGLVAEVLHNLDLGEQRRADEVAKGVVFVEPGDAQFQAAASVKASGAGIGTRQYFRFGGREMNCGPLGF